MTDIDEVLSRLDKKTQDGLVTASKLEIKKQRLPSIGMTRNLNGGLRYGSFHRFWGPTGSGKSLAAYQTLALAQQDGNSCVLVDAEGAFTKEWAEELGIDTSKLKIITDKNMEVATNKLIRLMQAGIDFVLVDSLSELIPPGEFEKDGELKDMSGTGAIGSQARGINAMLSKLSPANTKTCVLMIVQQTTKITPVGGIQEPQGGNRSNHIFTTSLKFGTNMAEKHRIMGSVTEGDLIFEEVVGRPVTWFVDKSRSGGMHSRGTYDIYFAGDFIGIDTVSELVDYGVQYGLIEKGGAWLTIEGERVQGRTKAIEYIRNDPDVRAKLEEGLLAV